MTGRDPSAEQQATTERPTGRSALFGCLSAHAVSMIGTRVSTIALPWFVLTTTGSATRTGLVALFETLPLVVAQGLSGPIVDRLGARRVSITADIASTLAVAVIPLLYAAGGLSFPALLALVAVTGTLRGPSESSKAALIPDIATAAGVTVERMSGLAGSVDRAAMIVGPAVAGGLIALIGPAAAITADAASFAICAALIARYCPRPADLKREDPAAQGDSAHDDIDEDIADAELSYLRRLAAGWQFMTGDPLLRSIAIMVGITNLLDAARSSVLVPVFMRDHGYGAAGIGVVGTAVGIAATGSSLLAAVYGQRLPRRLTYFVGFFVGGVPPVAVLAFDAPLWVVAVVGFVAGMGSGFLNPILFAVTIERVPRALLGRVLSMTDCVAWAGIPFGGVLAGAVLSIVGLGPTAVIAGAAYALTTTVPALQRRWRAMDHRP